MLAAQRRRSTTAFLALIAMVLLATATATLAAPALARRGDPSSAPDACENTLPATPTSARHYVVPTPTATSATVLAVEATPTPTLLARQARVLVRRTTMVVRNGRTYRIVRTATVNGGARPTFIPPHQVDAPPPPPPRPSSGGGAIPYGGPSGRPFDVTTAMVTAVNAVRFLNGVMSPLQANAQLASSCIRHALDMARTSTMSHTGSDGSNPAVRAQEAGYNWRYISENVAAGQSSLVQVMESWMNSPGHRANILSRSIKDMASAVAADPSGKYFWVQCFGSL